MGRVTVGAPPAQEEGITPDGLLQTSPPAAERTRQATVTVPRPAPLTGRSGGFHGQQLLHTGDQDGGTDDRGTGCCPSGPFPACYNLLLAQTWGRTPPSPALQLPMLGKLQILVEIPHVLLVPNAKSQASQQNAMNSREQTLGGEAEVPVGRQRPACAFPGPAPRVCPLLWESGSPLLEIHWHSSPGTTSALCSVGAVQVSAG